VYKGEIRCTYGQSLASTKFRRDGSHFAIVWAIRAGIGRIRLAHTRKLSYEQFVLGSALADFVIWPYQG